MLRTSKARRRTTRGFATVEVLVAVAVVMFVGTIALLTFGGGDRSRVEAEAAQVALFLQQARLRALESGRAVEVAFVDGALVAGPARHSPGNGTRIDALRGGTVIRPSGASDGLTLTVRRGEASRVVTLDWLTGRVETK
ncbi:hypothetical protein [Jannaschia aquimarina]|uniref:GspH protein n=1 Tax=Jannaschia aquimarina TaxID=935700 RepID=A0A0D1EDV9_9RHOB|nr:hypothetical protein [Jannaschia aquimarina]KIT15864.1 hypothetical protein jaqu_24440 [Jannaschia aquimarina]SNT10319.1 hypothetical protein SAMN05421775_105260 [Jannaschia aquimarina]